MDTLRARLFLHVTALITLVAALVIVATFPIEI
jgi:hypothetical protein